MFPETFKSLETLPKHCGLTSDAVDFFNVRLRCIADIMTDPVFTMLRTSWAFPKELYAGQEQRMQSYYLITRLPTFRSKQVHFAAALRANGQGQHDFVVSGSL